MISKSSNLDAVKRIFKIVYPLQRRRIYVHFRHVKKKLMKEFNMNRWEIDVFLFEVAQNMRDVSGCPPFYLSMCGSRASSRLNFISRAPRGEKATFSNSFCFICIDTRSLIVQEIIQEIQEKMMHVLR